jgi:hypothetical protein
METVLVVGDWLVDEHWVVGLHRSDSASRTGQHHSRALHNSETSVRSLCGAGQVATILFGATRAANPMFSILGLGIWHPGDENELKFMLDPKNNCNNTPFHLIPLARKNAATNELKRIALYNLTTDDQKDKVGTTRIIRVYERQSEGVVLRERIDWELRLEHGVSAEIAKHAPQMIQSMPKPNSVKHIILKDLGKGVVTSRLVNHLAKVYGKAAWHISTKDWLPKAAWYEALPKQSVELILVPQAAAQRAIHDGHIQGADWLTSGGRASKEALEALDKLSDEFPRANLVVLPHGMSLLAKSKARSAKSKDKETRVYIQADPGYGPHLGLVPMASVFFPSLITLLADNRAFKNALNMALRFTSIWMQKEYKRLRDDNWIPDSEQSFDLTKKYDDSRIHIGLDFGWNSAIRHWQEATTNRGITKYGNDGEKRKIQLWRAMTEVNGYVALVPSKRKVLKTLVEHGRTFAKENAGHTAFMLMDSPGTGKSYLAARLAKQLGMRMLAFNISQMLTRNDLLHAFDKVITTHAQDPSQKILIFVDEVNATLGNENVYAAFLSPLEDGTYVRDGDVWRIPPCFWLFAGTRRPEDDESDGKGSSNKGSDFESRLTLPPFQLEINDDAQDDRAALPTEKIYIGAATIQKYFPDAGKMTMAVVNAIDILSPTISPRGIANFVKDFRNVQHGMVTSANLGLEWYRKFNIPDEKYEIWKKSIGVKEWEEFVEFEITPQSGSIPI